jgi:hypothetical protein
MSLSVLVSHFLLSLSLSLSLDPFPSENLHTNIRINSIDCARIATESAFSPFLSLPFAFLNATEHV